VVKAIHNKKVELASNVIHLENNLEDVIYKDPLNSADFLPFSIRQALIEELNPFWQVF